MRTRRFLIGGLIIVAALFYLIYGGMRQAMVYFVTPSEIKAQETKSSQGKFLRVGGMVVKGSLDRNADGLTYRFQLTDGNAVIPVYFHGVPPDLFADGKGAVVEGKLDRDGLFIANTIMAKHAEEYSPAEHGKPDSPRKFIPAPEEKKS
jgi:cytochrome c-type biogenesis protein CcmE